MTDTITKEDFDSGYKKAISIFEEVRKVIIDKEIIILKVLMAILAKGHILIEDIPGVGKTTLALAFSKAIEMDYRRLQFTPDVLPSDVVGFSIYNKHTGTFEYKTGAAICNLFLADEINRTSPKTQSALLELMEEGKVTVDGITYELPKPFLVIATQNPIGSIGTQVLPESQLDRFMVCLTMGYPSAASEINILKGRQTYNPLSLVKQAVDMGELLILQDMVEQVYVNDFLYDYIIRLVVATRNHNLIDLGVSPRGSLAIMRMVKAAAFLKNRDYAVPDDIDFIFTDVCSHRILLSPKAKASKLTAESILTDIIKAVPLPARR